MCGGGGVSVAVSSVEMWSCRRACLGAQVEQRCEENCSKMFCFKSRILSLEQKLWMLKF